jgi:AraC family transcriptional regulator, regulatory protein of adaptative response / methylated-DNA-[protein]-cysteine methyltransferase
MIAASFGTLDSFREGATMSAVMKEQLGLLPDDQETKWQAVLSKDSRFDGQFVFAVSSTGIYCRPSCPSRRPRRDRVSFFQLPEAAEQAGFRACKRCHPRKARAMDPQIEMVQRVCRLIEAREGEPVTLAMLSEQLGVSSFHLQRTFKSIMGITPKQYIDACRIQKFKTQVRDGDSITAAMYEAGFSSSSRLYSRAPSELGMTPATYGRGGRGAVIHYAIAQCPLGRLLVAATERGVCAVRLGDSDEALQSDLRNEYPAADIKHSQAAVEKSVQLLLDYLRGEQPRLELPLDIQATAFQWKVWEKLRAIPLGETRSYGEVAKALGKPGAVRAVARACASNPVALVIPCHRVIREDQSLGGYRWGLERKRRLLDNERTAPEGTTSGK